MKPADLKFPFRSWGQGHVCIQDKVWYVPECESTIPFTFLGWNQPELFGNDNPIHLEYCSGNGAWIANRAEQNPHINWVALEMKFCRVRKIWSKIKNFNLSNLVVICGEGLHTTKNYFPSHGIDQVFINFPDPWPKRRHAKNRIIQPHFTSELQRILRPGGRVTFVTDDADYSTWTIKTFQNSPGFASVYPEPFYVHESADYGTSYFEDLWRSKGKMIYYHQFYTK